MYYFGIFILCMFGVYYLYTAYLSFMRMVDYYHNDQAISQAAREALALRVLIYAIAFVIALSWPIVTVVWFFLRKKGIGPSDLGVKP